MDDGANTLALHALATAPSGGFSHALDDPHGASRRLGAWFRGDPEGLRSGAADGFIADTSGGEFVASLDDASSRRGDADGVQRHEEDPRRD